MARYVRPRSLGTVFNNEKFFEANISSTVNNISSSSFVTKKANVESLKVFSSTAYCNRTETILPSVRTMVMFCT